MDEGAVVFRGQKFYRFRLKVDGVKGPASMYAHVFRDGINMVSVQWTFPIGDDGEISVPAAIVQFDEGVSIDLFSPSGN